MAAVYHNIHQTAQCDVNSVMKLKLDIAYGIRGQFAHVSIASKVRIEVTDRVLQPWRKTFMLW